jgi:hypothetical protein
MKYFLLDLTKLSIILLFWWTILNYFYNKKQFTYYEAFKYFPIYLILSIGIYAVLNVCYRITLIKDCDKEHEELLKEIEDGREFYKINNIKYN